MGEFSPLRYLDQHTECEGVSRWLAAAYLVELTRDPKIRQAVYTALPAATKDEKIQLSIVLARSGDRRHTVPYLQTMSMGPDKDDRSGGSAVSLRTLQARLP